MFYLREDVPLVDGHAIYIDSEWALTSISQRQFWRGVDFARARRRERRRDPLGRRLRLADARPAAPARSPARAAARRSATRSGASCTTTSTTREPATTSTCARGSSTRRSSSRTRRQATNLEPLLVNTAGSWADRPDAVTRDPEPVPGRRLRAHEHRPRDDGGRQRGGAPRGQRDPRRRAARRRRAATSGRCASRRCSAPARKRSTALRWKLFHRPAKPPLRVSGGRRSSSRPGRWRRAAGALGPLVRRLTRSEPGGGAARSSSSSPKASTGPSAPVPLTRPPAAARAAQAMNAAVNVVPVGAREVDLGELAPARRTPRAATHDSPAPVVPASGPSTSAAAARRRTCSAVAHARDPRGHRADQRARLHRPRERRRTSRGRR